MSTPVRAFETGQVAFASSAALRKAASSMPETSPLTVRVMPVSLKAAVVLVRAERDVGLDVEGLDGAPASPRIAENCIA